MTVLPGRTVCPFFDRGSSGVHRLSAVLPLYRGRTGRTPYGKALSSLAVLPVRPRGRTVWVNKVRRTMVRKQEGG